MQASIVVRPDVRAFDRWIRNEIATHMDQAVDRATPHIQGQVRRLLSIGIVNSPEMQELASPQSELHGEIGNPGIAHSIQLAADHWADTVRIIPRKTRFTPAVLTGGFLLQAVPASYGDILKQHFAEYTSVNAKGKATDIPWLSWFLLEGSNPVVENFYYNPNVSPHIAAKYSRTDQGLMRHKRGSFYRVPSQFSGTQGNNFVTRTIESLSSEILAIITHRIQIAW